MTPLQIIAEWEKGCSCGAPGECEPCTTAVVTALKNHYQRGPRFIRVMGNMKKKFTDGLQAKTGWGRNEVLALLDQCTVEALTEELDND